MSQEENAIQFLEKGKKEFKDGDYVSCIRSLMYAQQIFDAMHEKEQAAECLIMMGSSYLKLDKKEKSASMYVDALIRFKDVDNPKKVGDCSLVLGMIYRDIMKSVPKSKEYLKEAIEAFSKVNDLEKMGDSWRALAHARQSNPKIFLENLAEIAHNYETAIALYIKSKNDLDKF